jgi:hypothetical protein
MIPRDESNRKTLPVLMGSARPLRDLSEPFSHYLPGEIMKKLVRIAAALALIGFAGTACSSVTGPDEGVIGTGNGVIGTGNGVIGTGNGVIGTGNGVIGTGNGVIGTGN